MYENWVDDGNPAVKGVLMVIKVTLARSIYLTTRGKRENNRQYGKIMKIHEESVDE